MKLHWKPLSIALCIALLCALTPTSTNANDWNRKTHFTTSQPMEIPGNMILPAGEYTVKLLDLASTRNVVQFFSRDEKKLYNTVFAVPDYRLEPAAESTLTFYEQEPGRVQAVRSWFTKGSTTGLDFMYPKARADELARITGEKVITLEATKVEPLDSDAEMDSIPYIEPLRSDIDDKVIDDHTADVEPAAVEPEPNDMDQVSEPAPAPVPVVSEPATENESRELPKTSGVEGLLLLLSMGSSAGALALRKFRR